MLDGLYEIKGEQDIQEVEKRISELCQGEKGRCRLLRSSAYQQFRLKLLYGKYKTDTGKDDVYQINFTENRIKIVVNGGTLALYCAMLDDKSEFEGDAGKRKQQQDQDKDQDQEESLCL